jgi:phosphoribosylformylglycinamidine synthase
VTPVPQLRMFAAQGGFLLQWKFMKARVYVSMKTTVLDPQGQTVCHALNSLGHKEISSVRQGKFFEIAMADGLPKEKAAVALDEIARDVLSNPVIEDYRVEILD